jgi:hypothetical protein
LALMWDEVQQAPGMYNFGLWWGYFVILLVALAREDYVTADASATVLEHMAPPSHPKTPVSRSLVAAYRADDPTRLDLDGVIPFGGDVPECVLFYLVERDLPIPSSLIEVVRAHRVTGQTSDLVIAVAEALTSGDTLRLAAAIDAAEAGHLVVFAAHMRVVLAQRTGDPTPLARARPVLERLGDRQFLRRLEEVQRALT